MHNKEPDAELIGQLLTHQQQQFRLEERRVANEERRLQQEGYFLEKAMEINGLFLKNAPVQHRKTFITYAAVGIIVLLLFLSFILYCLISDKEEFVKNFLNWISHFVMTALGYWIGRSTIKSNKKGNQGNNEVMEAEVIQ